MQPAATGDAFPGLARLSALVSGEPTAKPATGSELHEAAAKNTENHTLPVMNELILLLLQRGVLNEAEGKSLLQKLKEKRS